MNQRPFSEQCDAVREALASGCYDAISREEVERHLKEHEACAQWAADLVLVNHLLAARGRRARMPQDIGDDMLEAYLRGALRQDEAARIEEACSGDTELAARLGAVRERLLRELRRIRDSEVLCRLRGFRRHERGRLSARLDEFDSLYLSGSLAMTASWDQETTFQTPDERLVVSVLHRGPQKEGQAHSITIGIRAHQPQWIGAWAYYEVTDAQGHLAAGGVLKVEPHGSSICVTVEQTKHRPYTVRVEMLDAQPGELAGLLRQIPGRTAPEADPPRQEPHGAG